MEKWEHIPGYEGKYKVSNAGRVKSLGRERKGRWGCIAAVKERILKQAEDRDGYLIVNLSVNGKTKVQKVHRIVADVFNPNPENKPTVNHLNGDKKDNRCCNLSWSTYSENITHAYEMGLKKAPSGENHYRFKK